MKKITYGALLTSVLVFFLASCNKDEIKPGPRIHVPAPEVPSVTIPISNPELSLTAFSNLPKSTPFVISIDGQSKEEFKIETTAKKKWNLGNLKPGTYKIRIYAGYIADDDATSLCFFQFNVFDGTKMQSVTCRKLDSRNYGFDLIVED